MSNHVAAEKAVLIERKGKYGTFYGCSNYPACDFASPGIPTGEKCVECGGYIISGIRGRKRAFLAFALSRRRRFDGRYRCDDAS